MNWEAVGALGELIGAAGVILSLIYLATQVRQSNQESRTAMIHAVAAAGRDWNRPFQTDRDLAHAWTIGSEDPSNLAPAEQSRFYNATFCFFRTFEDMHYQYRLGRFDADVWRGWEAQFGIYAKAPGQQMYWRARRSCYAPDFRDYIDTLKPPEIPRVGALVQTENGADAPIGDEST